MVRFKSYLKLFWQLVKTELLIFKQSVIGKIIDTAIWVAAVIGVVSYVFPQLGMSKGFGEFYAIGAIVSVGIFHIFPKTAAFVADITGNKKINYSFTLPLPSWLVILKDGVVYACETITMALVILPVSKLLLLNRLDLSNFSVIKFILMFFSLNFCIGLMSILMSSIVENIHTIEKIWVRILFPLWFFGGTQYSWKTMFEISPKLAYISLCNPILYATEGIRAATLGQEKYLSFWLCILMVWLFGIFFGWLGIKRLKKRLDFV